MGKLYVGGEDRRIIRREDQGPFRKNATGPAALIKKKYHFPILCLPIRTTEAIGRNSSFYESVPFLDTPLPNENEWPCHPQVLTLSEGMWPQQTGYLALGDESPLQRYVCDTSWYPGGHRIHGG